MQKSLKYFYLTVSGILFLSCGDPATTINTIKNVRIPIVLSENDIFQGNKVLAFLENEEKFSKEADMLFLSGLNSFRNNNDLDSGEFYLKESIMKEPSARAYFELGNLSMEQESYETAISAFGMAEQLNYEPFSKILYNKACIYSLQEDLEMSAQYLEYALQAGYNNLDHIDKDEDLFALRERSYQYNAALKKGMKGMSNAESMFWLQFKNKFSKTELPLLLKTSIGYEEMEYGYIPYDYEKYVSEMRNAQFSRDVGSEFYYFTQPYENENFVALVYIIREVYLGDYAPLTYVLATFSHEGKLIDKKIVAGGTSLNEDMLVATLNENMLIGVDYVKPIYQEDPNDHGYYDNPIINTELKSHTDYQISEIGKINEVFVESEEDLSSN